MSPPMPPPMAGYRTTAPFVSTQPPPEASSRLGIVAVILAALALLIVAGGAVVAFLFLRAQPAGVANGPTASPAPAVAGGAAISLPNVGASEEFDRADATAVPLKNHAGIQACAAKSRRFNGTIDVVLDVSAKDGRVIGTDCHTVYPRYDSKHPKLDPEAQEFCSCAQTATATWKFKPPKPTIVTPFGDSEWLHVKYIGSK
jgi:hypothetical protein